MLSTSLEKLVKTGRIPHALLFCSGSRSQREKAAAGFALEVTCHKKMDIHHFRPEGKSGMHAIESLRKLSEQVALYPLEGPRQCFILYDAEKMLPTSANALLKTLEEPISHSVIILIVQRKERLLPTLISRCQTVLFPAAAHELSPLQVQVAHLLRENGSLDAFETLAETLEKQKKQWEKEMLSTLPKELGAVQRERLEKEVEGAIALRYKEEAHSLLEVLYLWSYDQWLVQEGASSQVFNNEELKSGKSLAFSAVEKGLADVTLGLDRSMSFSTLLSCFFLQL